MSGRPVPTRKPTFTAGIAPSSASSSARAGAGVAVRRPAGGSTGSTTPTVNQVSKQMSNMEIAQTRRRLSIMGSNKGDASILDGDKQFDEVDHADIIKNVLENAEQASAEKKDQHIYTDFFSLSKVGYVPYNPDKTNQDRACEVAPFGKAKDKAFFGVFDGHGQLGHLVSQFVATNLPKYVMKQKDLDSNPSVALQNAFLACNSDLASGPIDCTFSGTTGVAIYIHGTKIYCANVGDSRAVIGQVVEGKVQALNLSSDHKPDREEERRRIISHNGRVEACKGPGGVDIGPARVWLRGQDVPGLAMTRSFGDLVAASVGVIARPEVEEHDFCAEDRMLIMGSDGIWEFITSQEAVEIAAQAKSPEQACQLLLDEAEKRWRTEEEVVDDITVLVLFF